MTHLQARLLFGSLLIGTVVGLVFADRALDQAICVPAFAMLLGYLALWELHRMMAERLPRPVACAAFVAALFPVALAPFFGLPLSDSPQALLLLAVLWPALWLFAPGITILWRRRLSGVQREDLDSLALSVLSICFTAFPMMCLALCASLPSGLEWVLIVVLGSKLNDIGGYLVGTAIGKHKLCPGISPGKSREGAVAGLVFGVLGTVILSKWLLTAPAEISIEASLLLGVLLAVTTQTGDLLESAVKRAAGVKDSAALIPAFGGIMDLLDSLIFAAPLGYALGVWWLA